MGRQIVSLLESAGGGGGSLPPKVILVPADFPTTLEAYSDVGRVYIMGANVTDNDPTKTNTGQSFLSGDEAVWDGATPTGSYFKLGASALWLDDGTDYKTISPARNLDLQNKDLKNVANAAIGNLSLTGNTITTASGDLNLNSFSNDIFMQNIIPDSLQFPTGATINTISTAIDALSTNTEGVTALAVWNAVQVENIWDYDTSGTPFIKPHNTGDHLHLNDEESASFATSEFQVFKNSAPDVSLWSASAVASEDANLNIIRSRGTIGTPTAVADDDLIGNINFIGYSGSAFNNGAEIRAEINGAVSAGVLPCDLVFYVNAGAGVATEGMRLLKTKDLAVVGGVIAASLKASADADGYLLITPSATAVTMEVGDDVTNIHVNQDTRDVNYNIWGTGASEPVFHTNAANNNAGINTNTPDANFALDVAGNLRTTGDFGSTSSRISKGWFTIIDSSSATIDNLLIDGNTISSTSGDINLTSVADINIKSTLATGVISWLKDTGLPALTYDNNTNQFTFFDDIAVAIGGDIEVNTINNNGSIFGVTVEGVALLGGNITLGTGSGDSSITFDSSNDLKMSWDVSETKLILQNQTTNGHTEFEVSYNGTGHASLRTRAAANSWLEMQNTATAVEIFYGSTVASFTINSQGANCDTIIEGDNVNNLFYVDADVDRIGVGKSNPTVLFDVGGEGKFIDLTTTGGRVVNVTAVNAATYDLLATDDIVHVTYTDTGAVTSLTLPSAQAGIDGRRIYIKDADGNAGTNSITIDTQGSEKIDGQDTLVINGDYGSAILYTADNHWYVIQ